MVLSKRERNVGIIAGATLVILLVNQFIIVPMEQSRDDLSVQIEKAQAELLSANSNIMKSTDARGRWAEMMRSGMRNDSSAAESQIYSSVNSWARDAGLNPPPALKMDRSEKEKDFQRITIRATGAGNMEQISRFLYRVQTANVPVRITDLTISSRKEGTDDLSLSMGLATIYLAPESNQRTRVASSAGGR